MRFTPSSLVCFIALAFGLAPAARAAPTELDWGDTHQHTSYTPDA